MEGTWRFTIGRSPRERNTFRKTGTLRHLPITTHLWHVVPLSHCEVQSCSINESPVNMWGRQSTYQNRPEQLRHPGETWSMLFLFFTVWRMDLKHQTFIFHLCRVSFLIGILFETVVAVHVGVTVYVHMDVVECSSTFQILSLFLTNTPPVWTVSPVFGRRSLR